MHILKNKVFDLYLNMEKDIHDVLLGDKNQFCNNVCIMN